MKKLIIWIVGTFFLCINSVYGQHNTYYIGHSGFGWDLMVGEMANDLATDAGHTSYDYGYQFIGGTCIANQWYSHDIPQGGTDSHVELPTGNYDVLIMAEQIPIQEVIYGSQWCNTNILTSVQSVDSFYTMATNANSNIRVYLMEFHNEVDQTGPTPFDAWSQLNTDMRPLWEQVADSVTLLNPGGPQVCIVPVAAAFEALADSVIAGSFPGMTNWIDLFDPNDLLEATIHPTEETYYIVACVLYSCIMGESPVGLTNETFAVGGWAYDPPTPAQALMMQEIAWEIVSNDPYACLPADSTGVGIYEAGLEKRFTAYPNPSKGEISFEFNGSQGRLFVFDITGRLIYENDHTVETLSTQFESGVYYATFVDELGNSSTQTIIVQ